MYIRDSLKVLETDLKAYKSISILLLRDMGLTMNKS